MYACGWFSTQHQLTSIRKNSSNNINNPKHQQKATWTRQTIRAEHENVPKLMFPKTSAKADSFNNSCSSLYLNRISSLISLCSLFLSHFLHSLTIFSEHFHFPKMALDILGSIPFCCCMQLMVFGLWLRRAIVA